MYTNIIEYIKKTLHLKQNVCEMSGKYIHPDNSSPTPRRENPTNTHYNRRRQRYQC